MSFKRYDRVLDAAGFEVRAADDGGPVVLRGYAAVFNETTVIYQTKTFRFTEVVRPGAFRYAIDSGQDVRALVDHDPSQMLGRTRAGTLTLREDDRGLAFELRLPDTQVARDLAENIKLGNISQNSFAFIPRPGGEETTTRTEGDVRVSESVVTSVDLYDISIVTYPAYPSTSVEVATRKREAMKAAKSAAVAPLRLRLEALEKRIV